MTMKKFLSFLVCAVMAFSAVSGIVPTADTLTGAAITAEAAEESSTSIEKTMLPYYYKQLSTSEKKLYIKLRKAVIAGKKSVTVSSSVSEDVFNKLTDCMFYYDPLTFNLNYTTFVTYTDGSAKIGLKYRFTKDSYDAMLEQMDAVAEKVISSFDENTSKYKKILYIHDYLTSNSVYVENNTTCHTAYGAMVAGQAVCDGYAQAFNYICRKAGIMVINVTGTADNVAHMWNKVYYKKQWYNVDVTWDDPEYAFDENATHDYFMISDSTLNQTHITEYYGFDIPEANDDSKNYYDMYQLTASSVTAGRDLLIKQIAKAAEKGKSSVTIKFSDKKTLDSFTKYMDKDSNISEIFAKANQKTDVEIITTGCYAAPYADTLTYNVFFFYPNTSISDYASDISLLAPEDIVFMQQLGIAA
jgi:hypothetical protein